VLLLLAKLNLRIIAECTVDDDASMNLSRMRLAL
jgi:hypothetical protein